MIAAIGQGADFSALPKEMHDGKRIATDKHFATPLEGVFACGDLNTGPDIAVGAIAEGHWRRIHQPLPHGGRPHRPFECDVVRVDLGGDFLDRKNSPRNTPFTVLGTSAFRPFEEYNLGSRRSRC